MFFTNDFTLNDIRNFISNMEKSYLIRAKETLIYIPIVGIKLYRRALFEQTKIDLFKKKLQEAENGTLEMKQTFIEQFTPILLENRKSQMKDNKLLNKKNDKQIRK